MNNGQHGDWLPFIWHAAPAGVVASCHIRAAVPMTAARLMSVHQTDTAHKCLSCAPYLGLVTVVQCVSHGDQGNHWLGVAQQPLIDDPPGHDGSHHHLAP